MTIQPLIFHSLLSLSSLLPLSFLGVQVNQSWAILMYLESLTAMKLNHLSSGSNLLEKLVPMEVSVSIS